MGRLIYSAIASLDGCVEDQEGKFDWAAPDDDVHRFINDLERPVGTYLYGRRMYETMLYWETIIPPAQPSVAGDFKAIWQAAEKIVYSRTLETVSSDRTRIERDFDLDAVRQLKATSQPSDLAIGGSEPWPLARRSRPALSDELQLFVVPVVVGGGKSWLPTGVRLDLELLDTRRFAGGAVYLRYLAQSA